VWNQKLTQGRNKDLRSLIGAANYSMVSTLFMIENRIGIRNESRPQTKYLS